MAGFNLDGIFNLAAQRPKTAAAVAIPVVAALSFGLYSLIPTRHERLEAWRSDYSSVCFTGSEKEPELKSRNAARSIFAVDTALQAIPPYGWQASNTLQHDIDRAVYCFADLDDTAKQYERWFFGNTFIIDMDYPKANIAQEYLRRETNQFWNSAVITMQPRYVLDSAIMLSRFQRGIDATFKVDQAFHLQKQFDEDVFSSAYWQALLKDGQLGEAAASYQSSWAEYDGVVDGNTTPAVLKTTLQTFLGNETLMSAEDVSFLSRYEDYLSDTETDCEVVGVDDEGNEIEECDSYEVSPAWYIHSVHLDPQTIVDLSAVYTNGANPFLTISDVESIMDDDQYRQLSDRAQSYYNAAWNRADYYCRNHDKGKVGNGDLAINYNTIDRYFLRVLAEPPEPRGDFYHVPGF